MFEKKLHNFAELPTREFDRKCTDFVCTMVGGLFAFILFFISLIVLDKEHLYETNFPVDSDSRPCGYDKNAQYPLLYFANINDINQRVCVSKCPEASDLQVECNPTSTFFSCSLVSVYETSLAFQRFGGVCLPADQSARNKLIADAHFSEKWHFFTYYDLVCLSVVISLCVGILWMIIGQLCPSILATLAIVLGSLLLMAFGALLLVDNVNQGQVFRIVIGSILILFGILFLAMLCLYKKRLKVTDIFIRYSAKFLGQRPINFIYIPIFVIMTLGMVALCLFEYLAISSMREPVKQEGDIYLHARGSNALIVMVFIQFVWAMQFLKDAFNFIVSGNGAEWYTREGTNCCFPLARLLKYNFGSVVGGSFLNAFFNFIDFLFQTFRCYPDGFCSACAPLSSSFSRCCGCFFDLVRTDTYAYINLTGIPYCNAARNCQVLCNSSRLFIGCQSVLFFYRLCAHVFCIGITILITYIFMRKDTISTVVLIIVMLISYCFVTYFIDIHADGAEGLQISYLLDKELSSMKASEFKEIKQELKQLEYLDEN